MKPNTNSSTYNQLHSFSSSEFDENGIVFIDYGNIFSEYTINGKRKVTFGPSLWMTFMNIYLKS